MMARMLPRSHLGRSFQFAVLVRNSFFCILQSLQPKLSGRKLVGGGGAAFFLKWQIAYNEHEDAKREPSFERPTA